MEVRRDETRELAINLLADLEEIERLITGPTPNRAQLRLFSVLLRRLFTQQKELQKVAECRIIDFRISVPDLKPIYDLDGPPFVFLAAGGGTIFGIESQCAVISLGTQTADLGDFNPSKSASLSIKDFLGSRTIYWRNRWFNRQQIIQFVANKLGGAHTGILSNNQEKKLKDLCGHGYISMVGGTSTISMQPPNTNLINGKLRLKPGEIDFVLFEVLSAMFLLINSQQTCQLRKAIALELS